MLTAKRFKNTKFEVAGGYIMPSGFGVYNASKKAWVAFSGKVFNPVGGKSSTEEVAKECNPEDMQYIYEMV